MTVIPLLIISVWSVAGASPHCHVTAAQRSAHRCCRCVAPAFPLGPFLRSPIATALHRTAVLIGMRLFKRFVQALHPRNFTPKAIKQRLLQMLTPKGMVQLAMAVALQQAGAVLAQTVRAAATATPISVAASMRQLMQATADQIMQPGTYIAALGLPAGIDQASWTAFVQNRIESAVLTAGLESSATLRRYFRQLHFVLSLAQGYQLDMAQHAGGKAPLQTHRPQTDQQLQLNKDVANLLSSVAADVHRCKGAAMRQGKGSKDVASQSLLDHASSLQKGCPIYRRIMDLRCVKSSWDQQHWLSSDGTRLWSGGDSTNSILMALSQYVRLAKLAPVAAMFGTMTRDERHVTDVIHLIKQYPNIRHVSAFGHSHAGHTSLLASKSLMRRLTAVDVDAYVYNPAGAMHVPLLPHAPMNEPNLYMTVVRGEIVSMWCDMCVPLDSAAAIDFIQMPDLSPLQRHSLAPAIDGIFRRSHNMHATQPQTKIKRDAGSV